MKQLYLAIFCLFILCNISGAQYHVTGVVTDAATEKPLAGASVFINGASQGTVTDKEGKFIIDNISFSSFELVISFVSYETITIKISDDNINKRFRIGMSLKQNQLKEVVVGPIEKDGWKTWGPVFVQHFIGTSNNAKQCVLKNPGVLRFRYNKKARVLTVTSGDKLIIDNNALGYTLQYQLEEFTYDQKNRAVTYLGYSSFQPKTAPRKRKLEQWESNRAEAYNGSLMHFMRSFHNNKVEQEGFEMISLTRLYKRDSATRIYYDRIIKGNYSDVDTSKYAVQIMKSDAVFDSAPVIFLIGKKPLQTSEVRVADSTGKNIYASFNYDIQLTYTKELEKAEYVSQIAPTRKDRGPQTSIIFLVNNRPIMVESSGLYFEPLDLFTEGYLAWEKLAEMLPTDYQPNSRK